MEDSETPIASREPVIVQWSDSWGNDGTYAPPEMMLLEPELVLEDIGFLVGSTRRGVFLAHSRHCKGNTVRGAAFIPRRMIVRITRLTKEVPI